MSCLTDGSAVGESPRNETPARGAGIVAQPEVIARLSALGLDNCDLDATVAKRKTDFSGRAIAASECLEGPPGRVCIAYYATPL
jgi:hypothetical protein